MLSRYRAVARGLRPPLYAGAARQKCGAENLSELGPDALWRAHDGGPARGGRSRLDLKVEIAERLALSCALCERRCGVNRTAGETGFCGVTGSSHLFFEQILLGEERPLIPSHEVFLSGCNMRCRTCYAWREIQDPRAGRMLTPEGLAEILDSRRREGAANVNLLGGEPTVHLPFILRTLSRITVPTAVVWNSNFLMSPETMRLLNGVVDLYVGDFRFGNDDCASKVSATEGYFRTAARNFLEASKGELIIRHLVLPGHVECCLRPVAEWVAERLPRTPFNLMFQYTPPPQTTDDPLLSRPLHTQEKQKAREIVRSLSLNTYRWNTPLRGMNTGLTGEGELTTTITILPDGTVSLMHLHADLLHLADSLERRD